MRPLREAPEPAYDGAVGDPRGAMSARLERK